MKLKLALLSVLLAVCSALGATSASASPAGDWIGHGLITAGIPNHNWCLAIKGTTGAGGQYPVLYAVQCGSAGVWQPYFQVRLSGESPTFEGSIRPTANLSLCVGENPSTRSNIANILPCDETPLLEFTDLAPAKSVSEEHWQVSLNGAYLAFATPLTQETRARFVLTKNARKYVQVFQLQFPLTEPGQPL